MTFIKKWTGLVMELGKVRITFSVTITTAIGYYLAPEPWSGNVIWPVMGILAIGLGSASLNHIQDRSIDVKMHRTRNRPFPTNRVNVPQALLVVLLFVISGSAILYFFSGILPMILGLSALVWYNGIYTYLKRVSSIAVIPGAIIGGIPPALGWVSAGGSPYDPFILSVSAMLVIWQIPHFWLLLFMYSEDYDRAGLPNLIHILSEYKMRLVTFATIVLTIASAFVIFYEGKIIMHWTAALSVLAGARLLWDSRNMMTADRPVNYRGVFMSVNLYTLVVLVLVLIGRFFK